VAAYETAIVRLYSWAGTRPTAGLGLLVGTGQLVTCAHVVNSALGRALREQAQPGESDLVQVEFPQLPEMPVRQAQVVTWVPPPIRGGGGDLAGPVERLSAVVLDHLTHEEREVLPLLEQHLTRAQWRAFLHKERNRRSPRERPEFLTWILDDADDQDAAAVLTEMPPPARLVYRRILKPRYEAQHRWQIPSPTAESATGRP